MQFVSYANIHRFSLVIASVFILYPVLVSTNIFPQKQIISAVTIISEDRAGSLNYRFTHERALLDHAGTKPLFGWGSWGRNRVYDSETGEDHSVTDGKLILTIGTRGWVGFVSEFFLIIFGLILAFKAHKKLVREKAEKNKLILLSSHTLFVTILLIDQVPNSSLNMLYWLIIGSLMGHSLTILKRPKHSIQQG